MQFERNARASLWCVLLASVVHCVDGFVSVVRCGDFVAFTGSLILEIGVEVA